MSRCKGCGRSLTPSETGKPPDCESMDRDVFDADQATAVELTIAEAAKKLAEKHYEIETGVKQIFKIVDRVDVTLMPGPLAGQGGLPRSSFWR